MTHICVIKLAAIIGSDNGLSPGRRHAIICTNVAISLIRTLVIDFSDILSEDLAFGHFVQYWIGTQEWSTDSSVF